MIFDPIYVTYSLVVLVVVLLGLVIHMEVKLKKLLRGKNAESLEGAIIESLDNIKKLNDFQQQVINHFVSIEKRLKRSIQAVETIRFNPFKGTGEGGNQSFTTSFISENGKGVVLSSLYSRDRVSVFSKPLDKFESPFELTEEEKEVINNSKKNLG
ncbi:MAG: DUF4446 family protein [Parcubacteria group bacterium]